MGIGPLDFRSSVYYTIILYLFGGLNLKINEMSIGPLDTSSGTVLLGHLLPSDYQTKLTEIMHIHLFP